MSNLIFGRTWEEIQDMQQRKNHSRPISSTQKACISHVDSNGNISDEFYNQLYAEAIGVRWVMFLAGAQPTKSDVENVLMERHGIGRDWPHIVMNHLETTNTLIDSIHRREWCEIGEEPQMASDILSYIKEKASKSAVVCRHLNNEYLKCS